MTTEKNKGCGKEVCGVTIDIDGDVDISLCGDYCSYHREVHYCDKCLQKYPKGHKQEKKDED